MRIRVQSRHFLDEGLLVKLWHRSDATESERHYPLGKKFEDWRRNKPQTDLGVVDSDQIYFWMNWVNTSNGLVPVIDTAVIGYPDEWRLVVELEEEERNIYWIFKEDESSVYVFYYVIGKTMRFRLIRKGGPRVEKTDLDEPPKWLADKIATMFVGSENPSVIPEWLASKLAAIREEQSKVVKMGISKVRLQFEKLKLKQRRA